MAELALALELSSPRAQFALGRGAELLRVVTLPDKTRHNLDLMPALDATCRELGLRPTDLAECYVSLGPGSFTGLRVALATAKMLALVSGVRLVGIPTLEVLIAQHPDHVVALAVKRDNAWSGGAGLPPAFRSVAELVEMNQPLVMDWPAGGDPAPDHVHPARPNAEALYQLACARAACNDYDDPATLLPLYQRQPEAVTLWNQRHPTLSPK